MADFAREAREFFYESSIDEWSDEQARQMNAWLIDDDASVDGESRRPLDVLADFELATRLLSALREAS